MALTRTTLSAAVAIGDGSLTVTAATGVAAGVSILVDQEMMKVTKGYVAASTTVPVVRGQDGTVVTAHPSGASVVIGTGADWATQAPQTEVLYPIAGRARTLKSYTASGAISLPAAGSDAVAVLNGTSTLTMTLAVPNKDMDGSIITITGNGAGAHTVTVAADVSSASGLNVFTFNASGVAAIQMIAMNEVWLLLGAVGGTLTNAVATLA